MDGDGLVFFQSSAFFLGILERSMDPGRTSFVLICKNRSLGPWKSDPVASKGLHGTGWGRVVVTGTDSPRVLHFVWDISVRSPSF